MVNFVMVIDLNGILCYAFGSNIGSSYPDKQKKRNELEEQKIHYFSADKEL